MRAKILKYSFFLLACLLLFKANASLAAPAADDQPGKFRSSMPVAFDFSLNNSFFYSESFAGGSDIDYYKISVPRKAYIDIRTSNQADSRIDLLDENNNLISFDLSNAEDFNARLVYEVPAAGIYFIKLTSPSLSKSFYDLELDLIESNTRTDDFDNKIDPGFLINLSQANSEHSNLGKINYPGDTDFFKLENSNSGPIKIELKASSNQKFKLSLYDPALNLITMKESKSDISIDKNLAQATYIISLQGEKNSNLDYELKVTHNDLISDQDGDQLDNFKGRSIVLGENSKRISRKEITAELNYIGDIDVFRITVPDQGTLVNNTGKSKKRIKRGQRLTAILYNENFQEIERDLTGATFFFSNRVQPGNYYLSISSRGKVLGKYKIKNAFIRLKQEFINE